MNVSAITSNKPSLSSEHLKYNLMPWIILKLSVISPQFTNPLSLMHPNGNTQLHIRKWWVPLISALYIFSFWSYLCQYLSIISNICPAKKSIKETVHFSKTIILHPSTAPLSNVKLKRVSKVYNVLYNNSAGKNTMY